MPGPSRRVATCMMHAIVPCRMHAAPCRSNFMDRLELLSLPGAFMEAVKTGSTPFTVTSIRFKSGAGHTRHASSGVTIRRGEAGQAV
jgi:hypothetical protein